MPGDAVPWRITDSALAGLADHLLGHEPERGAALLGPPGERLVTHVLPDPQSGSAASYRHSDALRQALADALTRRPDLGYRGTAHSHPGAWAEPSAQDARASRAVLTANPALADDALFPIAVAVPPSALGNLTGTGGGHLLPAGGGSLAGYTCRGTALLPATLSALPVRRVLDALCDGTTGTAREIGVLREAATGRVWLGYEFGAGPRILLALGFPTDAPMVSTGSEPFRPLPWDPTEPLPERIARARETLCS